MSVKATAAARRPAMSLLLQRMLDTVIGWFRHWFDSRQVPSRTPARRATVALEALEPRLLLSADLVGSVAVSSIPDEVLPSDNLNVSVIVQNIGSSAAGLTPVVRLYASNTGQIDANSIVLGESSVKGNQINTACSPPTARTGRG